jgi:hypothetical protein
MVTIVVFITGVIPILFKVIAVCFKVAINITVNVIIAVASTPGVVVFIFFF